MRAFVRMRGVLAANKALARRFAELETRLGRLDKKTARQDEAIAAIMSAIRELMNPPHATHTRYRLHRQVRRVASASPTQLLLVCRRRVNKPAAMAAAALTNMEPK